jgi:hypothetical protein
MFTGQLNEGMNALLQPQKKERKKEGNFKKKQKQEIFFITGLALLCS